MFVDSLLVHPSPHQSSNPEHTQTPKSQRTRNINAPTTTHSNKTPNQTTMTDKKTPGSERRDSVIESIGDQTKGPNRMWPPLPSLNLNEQAKPAVSEPNGESTTKKEGGSQQFLSLAPVMHPKCTMDLRLE